MQAIINKEGLLVLMTNNDKEHKDLEQWLKINKPTAIVKTI